MARVMTNDTDIRVVYTGKYARQALGVPLRKIEEDTGISKGTICKWENGYCAPSFLQLAVVADYLGVDWNELIVVKKGGN
jgi:transcriptional regulator with XRE-family HTH domain